jgi:hypothetical protein
MLHNTSNCTKGLLALSLLPRYIGNICYITLVISTKGLLALSLLPTYIGNIFYITLVISTKGLLALSLLPRYIGNIFLDKQMECLVCTCVWQIFKPHHQFQYHCYADAPCHPRALKYCIHTNCKINMAIISNCISMPSVCIKLIMSLFKT